MAPQSVVPSVRKKRVRKEDECWKESEVARLSHPARNGVACERREDERDEERDKQRIVEGAEEGERPHLTSPIR